MVWPELVAATLARHAEACAPFEACGVVLEHSDGRLEVRPLTNAYDRFHARDPIAWPRTSRTAFLIAPSDWMALEREADAAAARIAWLYHSHLDGPDEPSADDQAFAAPGGAPLVAGLGLLIIPVRGGRAAGCGVFRWSNGHFERVKKSDEMGTVQFVKKGSSGL